MEVKIVEVKSVMTKSKLPSADYAVNPYIGCPHKCKYCYASFMKRFTNHPEPWGEFLDVKECPPIKNPEKYRGKNIFIGSVTDGYNPFEKKYEKTKNILEQLIGSGARISITTKSNLIVRDIELLKKFDDIKVAFSINTLDEEFRKDMDKASSIKERIEAMKILHENGIPTATFISPIFPGITNVPDIAMATKDYCDEIWLENLNLRGAYKSVILKYIEDKYKQLIPMYRDIYTKSDKSYWVNLSEELLKYAKENDINMINYFYHELIRKH